MCWMRTLGVGELANACDREIIAKASEISTYNQKRVEPDLAVGDFADLRGCLQGSGFRVSKFGFRVSDFGFRMHGLGRGTWMWVTSRMRVIAASRGVAPSLTTVLHSKEWWLAIGGIGSGVGG